MEYPIRNDDYEKAKKEARETYDKIGRVWSPAFNDYVSFNNIGFWHLIRKGNRRRPHAHQIKRFALISCAKEIISNSATSLSEREHMEDGRHLRFWAFRGALDKRSIRVIVRQAGNSRKHFFSVFEEDKQKTTPE
jgi:hypothetical protein